MKRFNEEAMRIMSDYATLAGYILWVSIVPNKTGCLPFPEFRLCPT